MFIFLLRIQELACGELLLAVVGRSQEDSFALCALLVDVSSPSVLLSVLCGIWRFWGCVTRQRADWSPTKTMYAFHYAHLRPDRACSERGGVCSVCPGHP